MDLLLRILYTINSSPQYILARSLSSVHVTPHDATRLEFGTVSLKTCLDIICRSSPELLQDSRRDFSVYFLDPLESGSAPAPVNISNQPSGSQTPNDSYEQPRGVAVGLGAMSLALSSDKDSSVVTGTLIKLSNGQNALQVIFALQEMATSQKVSLHGGVTSWSQSSDQLPNTHIRACTSSGHQTPYGTDFATNSTISSIQKRSQDKRAKAKIKKPPKPPLLNAMNSEADRLMLSHDIYVGPTRKKGRPSNTVASGSRCKNPTGGSAPKHALAPEDADTVLVEQDGCPKHTSSANQVHHILPTKQPLSHAPDAPDASSGSAHFPPDQQASFSILSYISALSSSGDPNAQNAALLAVLNAIDSKPGASPSKLGDRAQNPTFVDALRYLLSAASQRSHSVSDSRDSQHSSSVQTRSPDDEIVLLDKENVNPAVFRRRNERDAKSLSLEAPSQATDGEPTPSRSLSIRSNGSINTSSVTPASTNLSVNRSGGRRKRTLSDFMDERESKNKMDRRDAYRSIYSSPTRKPGPSTHRHYPRLVSDSSQVRRKSTNSYYRTGMTFWTSPPRPTNENVKINHERGKSCEESVAIVDSPEHSRIAASSPARSILTQPQVRRKYIVPAWARTETSTQPRLSEEARRALELAETRKREEKEAKKKGRRAGEKEQRKRLMRTPSPSQRASRNVRQKSTSTTHATQCPPPVTVASDCPVFAITSAIQDRVAAFMSSDPPRPPSPQSSKSSVISPCTPPRTRHTDLFTPGVGGSLFTPLPAEKASGSTRSPLGIGQNQVSNVEEQDDSEEILSQELSMALERLNTPSNSHLIVGSIPAITDSFADESSQGEDSAVELRRMQHWEGLPPSSPLPPTSPITTLQGEESDALSDDMELPAANSDPEPFPTDSEISQDSYSMSHAPIPSDDDDLPRNGLPSPFSFSDDQTVLGDAEPSALNTIDNFGITTNSDLGMLNNDLLDFDSTEFWETFNSLLHNQSGEAARTFNSEFFQRQVPDMMDHDHARLAEDVQALFGGCLM